jgi:hypothetical protein
MAECSLVAVLALEQAGGLWGAGDSQHRRIKPPGAHFQSCPSTSSNPQPVQPAVGEMKAWLLPSGGVLCVDQGFVDYTGWATGDLVGRALSSVALDPGELERCGSC